jgi:membrane protein YqaA with SNARE-associated domain
MGALGLFSVAVIDSSVIPLPLPGSTDLLLLWLVAHSGDPWSLTLCAISGSILGGYSTWYIGRRGGEAALRSYVPVRLLGPIVKWVERHPILAVFIPAVLPPPIPLLPFALASGALGVSHKRFLLVFGVARSLRYSLVETYRSGQLHCFASLSVYWLSVYALESSRFAECARSMQRRNLCRKQMFFRRIDRSAYFVAA